MLLSVKSPGKPKFKRSSKELDKVSDGLSDIEQDIPVKEQYPS